MAPTRGRPDDGNMEQTQTSNTTWTRPREGRVIAGVAAGAARQLGITPEVVRLIFILLACTGGLALPLYIAGWLLMPEEGSDRPLMADAVESFKNGEGNRNLAVVLIAVGAIIVVGPMMSFHPWILGAGLVVAGALLLQKH